MLNEEKTIEELMLEYCEYNPLINVKKGLFSKFELLDNLKNSFKVCLKTFS